ncbi:MAG: hypothetical protein WD651_11455 [Acidimicrobiia bacterium]
MSILKGIGAILAVIGLGVFVRRQRNHSLQETIEANWKDIKKKLPTDWSEIAPKKRKQAKKLIETIHDATGESRRRIRKSLRELTA